MKKSTLLYSLSLITMLSMITIAYLIEPILVIISYFLAYVIGGTIFADALRYELKGEWAERSRLKRKSKERARAYLHHWLVPDHIAFLLILPCLILGLLFHLAFIQIAIVLWLFAFGYDFIEHLVKGRWLFGFRPHAGIVFLSRE